MPGDRTTSPAQSSQLCGPRARSSFLKCNGHINFLCYCRQCSLAANTHSLCVPPHPLSWNCKPSRFVTKHHRRKEHSEGKNPFLTPALSVNSQIILHYLTVMFKVKPLINFPVNCERDQSHVHKSALLIDLLVKCKTACFICLSCKTKGLQYSSGSG